MYKNLLIEKKDYIATLTVNKEKVMNAVNRETRFEMLEAVKELDKDDEVRVIIITGAGDKAFIAGADINEFKDASPIEILEDFKPPRVWEIVEWVNKPVIAKINGYCLGGGNELIAGCDFKIASSKSKFGQPEINLGIIPGGGGCIRLTRTIGITRATHMVMTGDMIDAKTALEWGLVSEVVEPDKLDARVWELASKLAAKSPVALKMAKHAVKAALRMPVDQAISHEVQLFSLCFASEDKDEGVSAFLEKRKPEFKGK